MKRLLNPRFREENMIGIEESSNEEDTHYKRIRGMISQDIKSIKENIRSIPDVPVKKFVDKSKELISESSEGRRRKYSCNEVEMECMQVLNPKGLVEEPMISFPEVSVKEHINKEMDYMEERMQTSEQTKITSLRKALHHYKAPNSHLNQLND